MRLIDADIGREKLWEIYNAWNLAMAPAEGREIAYVDKKMRLCELMIKFLDQLPTIPPPPNDPLTLEELQEMDGEPVWNDTTKKWAIVDIYSQFGPRTVSQGGRWRPLDDRYYRHRPEALGGEAAPALSRPKAGPWEGNI